MRCSSGGEFRGEWYSGWIVLEWMPRSCSAFRIWEAMGMKSCFRDAMTCTDATILVSDSCQMCSSCTDSTPSTSRIAARTSSSSIVAGTPCNKMKAVLRTTNSHQHLVCPCVHEIRRTEW